MMVTLAVGVVSEDGCALRIGRRKSWGQAPRSPLSPRPLEPESPCSAPLLPPQCLSPVTPQQTRVEAAHTSRKFRGPNTQSSITGLSRGMAVAFQHLPAALPVPYCLGSGSPGQCVNTSIPRAPGGLRRRRQATVRGSGQEVRKPGGQSFFLLFHFLPEMRRKSLSVPNSLVGGRRGVGSKGHEGESDPAPPSCRFTDPNHSPALGSGMQYSENSQACPACVHSLSLPCPPLSPGVCSDSCPLSR